MPHPTDSPRSEELDAECGGVAAQASWVAAPNRPLMWHRNFRHRHADTSALIAGRDIVRKSHRVPQMVRSAAIWRLRRAQATSTIGPPATLKIIFPSRRTRTGFQASASVWACSIGGRASCCGAAKTSLWPSWASLAWPCCSSSASPRWRCAQRRGNLTVAASRKPLSRSDGTTTHPSPGLYRAMHSHPRCQAAFRARMGARDQARRLSADRPLGRQDCAPVHPAGP
jgi:hypothetical protein